MSPLIQHKFQSFRFANFNFFFKALAFLFFSYSRLTSGLFILTGNGVCFFPAKWKIMVRNRSIPALVDEETNKGGSAWVNVSNCY